MHRHCCLDLLRFNINKIIGIGLRDTHQYPHMDPKKWEKKSYFLNQISVWELVAPDSSAFGSPCSICRHAGWEPGWGGASLPHKHKASSARVLRGRGRCAFCLCRGNCQGWVWLADWKSLHFVVLCFLGTRIISSFMCDFFFSVWEIILCSCPLWWPFLISI